MRIRGARRAALALMVAVSATAATTACGAWPSSGAAGPSGRTFGTETWYAAAPGSSPDQIELRFDGPVGPAGDECEPARAVAIEPDPAAVRVTVKRFEPPPVVACRTETQTITAALPEPLGDRPLVNPQTGWRFRPVGGRLELDPDSTPCGRADCSTPAPVPATCQPLEYQAVVAEQVQAREPGSEDARCDGSFLVLTRGGHRAWFVNRQASWRLVALDHRRCDQVWKEQRVRFPAALC
jgi:hypothetical protein